jgi:hypothetical protein
LYRFSLSSFFRSKSSWTLLAFICFSFIILGIIAGVVVLSLISLYVKSPSITLEKNEEICAPGYGKYPINGSSILGKYSSAAVAVDNLVCSTIGRQILERNGTTMDATLAAAICNGVMTAQSMGIGGGCVITVYSKYRRNKIFLFKKFLNINSFFRKRNKAYSIIGVSCIKLIYFVRIIFREKKHH